MAGDLRRRVYLKVGDLSSHGECASQPLHPVRCGKPELTGSAAPGVLAVGEDCGLGIVGLSGRRVCVLR